MPLGKYEWREDSWICYGCNSSGKRVVLIQGSYYCEACLFKAIVIDGTLSLLGGCDNCGDPLNGSAYCETCKEASQNTCSNCGEPEAYCYDCTMSDHSCSNECSNCYDTAEFCSDCAHRNCEECGDDNVEVWLCSSCMTDRNGCSECGSPELTIRLCDEHEPVVSAAAAQRVDTDDGATFEFDDGMVVNWGDS